MIVGAALGIGTALFICIRPSNNLQQDLASAPADSVEDHRQLFLPADVVPQARTTQPGTAANRPQPAADSPPAPPKQPPLKKVITDADINPPTAVDNESQTGPPPAGQTSPQRREVRYYKVRPGDTLSKIAQNYYGDPKKWEQILHANSDRIKNGTIYPDMVLVIP